MVQKSSIKPLALALGAAFATSLSGPAVVNAAENPFAMTELSSGYLVAEAAEGKCGGSMAGDKTTKEGKCGEGKCGEGKAADKTTKEGKCGEGKCGEGKAADKTAKEGKCGGNK
jgi:uncharacterized low-complexity protein